MSDHQAYTQRSRVRLRCQGCGHEFETRMCVNPTQCPKCNGLDWLITEWHQEVPEFTLVSYGVGHMPKLEGPTDG